jgi:hypothetical protein
MKKFTILIAAIALVCFSVPAMAVEWNFYGSARVNTWYVSTDLNDKPLSTTGDDKDSEVRWGSNGQDNSRLGAKVKHENLSGRIEIQLKANAGGDDGGDNVDNRLVYGEWNFGAGKLKVGKDYTPVSQFISAETFDEDLGLLGIGTAYGNRTAGLFLTFGGFQLALLEPTQNDITDLGGTATGGDIDSYIPKIEAKYGMAFDAFNFNVMGGYNYYSIEDVASLVNVGTTNNISVTSYIVGADAGFNFGPAYVKGSVSYGQNWKEASWCLNGLRTAGSPAIWDNDDDTKDTDSFMGALVAGMKVSDMLSFEGGFGYRYDDYDVDQANDKDKAWEAYINSTIVLAPGVYLVPEIGYADGMKDAAGDDDPTFYWVGAKWQIDF